MVEENGVLGMWKVGASGRRRWGESSKHISMKVGEGRKVKFREHIWCGDVRLRDAYPSIFRLAANGDAAVADYLKLEGDSVRWDVTLRPEVVDWELDELLDLIGKLYAIKDMGKGEDC